MNSTIKPLRQHYKPTFSHDDIAKKVIRHSLLSFSYATTFLSDTLIDTLYHQYQDSLWTAWQTIETQKISTYKYNRHPHPLHDYHTTRHHIQTLANTIRNDRSITHVVQMGIGGSLLGPQATYEGLRRLIPKKDRLPAFFISNLDTDDFDDIIDHVPLSNTVFIIVSKSGHTEETTQNLNRLYSVAKKHRIASIDDHIITITTAGSPLDQPDRFRAVFHIPSHTGGRYSTTSAVGGVLLSICLGFDLFNQFLAGAHALDTHAENKNPYQNMCLLAALISIWHRHYLGYPNQAIIPYSQALHRFPAHIQQLMCESNGKSVTASGNTINYPTSPLVFGEPGTAAQHSFFQLLHQGTDIIPVQFIAFQQTQLTPVSQPSLLAHVIAQMISLADGHHTTDPTTSFPGQRPSTLLFAPQLTAKTMGALFSFYENMTVFQGCLWQLNPFDQPGVELGKTIAKTVQKEQTSTKKIEAFKQLLF